MTPIDSHLPEHPSDASSRPTTFYLQGNDARLQLVPASTTTKANRANSDFVALQTTGVERNSSDLHLHQETNNRARERACTTGVLRNIATDRRTKIDSNNNKPKVRYHRQHQSERENEPVLQECSAAQRLPTSERTCLYYRSAPQQSPITREHACTTGVLRDKQQHDEGTCLCYRSAPQHTTLPAARERA
jgi:hypothetical protein